jgi:hypothetical protein
MQLTEIGVRIQNDWVFRLLPSSNILETRARDVSESGFVSILR